MKPFAKHRWWWFTISLTLPTFALAAGGRHVFSPGTVISAAAVNENFQGLDARLAALEARSAPIITYVRWGKTTCTNDARAVYVGFAAGNHFELPGSGAGTLCLHDTPEWLSYDDANQNPAVIFGTEYQTSGYGVGLDSNHDGDAPCVVCEVPRAAELMVPGRTSCPAGWTLEYNGYLMSHQMDETSSDWACVDAAAEGRGSPGNENGHLWYPTEVECGALPCLSGGYVQNREVTCAVCTK